MNRIATPATGTAITRGGAVLAGPRHTVIAVPTGTTGATQAGFAVCGRDAAASATRAATASILTGLGRGPALPAFAAVAGVGGRAVAARGGPCSAAALCARLATGTAIATIGVAEDAVTTATALTAYPGVTAVTAVTIGAEQ